MVAPRNSLERRAFLAFIGLVVSFVVLGACSLTNLSDLTGGIPGGTGTALYSIGGTVSGLEGTSVKVARNADDVVTVAADGRFTFQQKLPTGALYVITVLRVPP